MGMANKRDRKRLSVRAASDFVPVFGVFRVNPGYPVNDHQSLHVVAHCSPALDKPALGGDSSFFSTPRHRVSDRLACLRLLLVAGTDTKLFFVRATRSMCK
jgi:hypothetical protein